jgi:hypothetical protein
MQRALLPTLKSWHSKIGISSFSEHGDNMKKLLVILALGALTAGITATASAHVSVGIYADVPAPYYPPVVQYQPRYVEAPTYYREPAPTYYREPEVYVDPGWQARREWRERREEQWRRREGWRREQWRHAHRDWDERD